MPLFRSGRGGSTPTSALQLQIKRCSLKRAIELNELWHSRFPIAPYNNMVRSGWVNCYLAEHNEICYATAIWTRPIAANRLKDEYRLLELRRMAIADDAPKNTASRMLRIMKNMIKKDQPEVIRLISYQDTESHDGTIYKASGWRIANRSKFVSWSNHSARPGKVEQSKAEKIRWEFPLQNDGGVA